MRHLIYIGLIVGLLASSFNALAQDKKHSKEVEQLMFSANDHYDREDYALAATEYEAIAHFSPNTFYPAYRLAESYRHFFEYELAEKWYKKALELDKEGEYPLIVYWYANMQKMNGNYIEAEKSFETFLSTFQPATPEEEIYLEYALLDYNGCVLALDELSKPYRNYNFSNLGKHVNTKHLEFAPAIFGNDSLIVITSSREGSKGEEQFSMFGESYCDNYRFEYGKHGWKQINNHKDHFDVLNTVRNDGSGVLTADGKKFYYTICDERTMGECAIYVANFDGHKWHHPKKLNDNINPEGIWNAQPTLSGSGDTMYFVSKRPGGLGDNDIWYSVDQGEDMWGEAVNLGDQVNTPFVDMCPDFHIPTNSLFFASNGHEGFGGLDIYQAREITSGVHNLGLPFNSNRDDFYFVLGEKKGYLASNRDGENDNSQGHDDVYWFDFNSHETLITGIDRDTTYKSIDIEGTLLVEETREAVSDVSVILTQDGKIVMKTTTDELGKFSFKNLSSMEDYLLKLNEGNPNLTDDIKYILDQIKVKKTQEPVRRTLFENIYFDFDKSAIRPEAKKTLDLLVEFQKANPDVQIELKGNTDSKGSDDYNNKLAKRRSNAAFNYLIKRGFPKTALVTSGFGEGSPIASNKNEIGRQLNRRVEFYVRGSNKPNSEYMTYVVERKKGLKQIGEMFDMTIDQIKQANNLRSNNLRAFTPLRVLRGSTMEMVAPSTMLASNMESYNVGHSDDSEVAIDPNAPKDVILVMKNSKTGKTYKGIKINSYQIYNSYNLKGNENVQAKAGESIYVVKPLDILSKIAKEHNMEVAELKSLNGLKSNRIQIGQRLRVKN